jgi:hypothetical protein
MLDDMAALRGETENVDRQQCRVLKQAASEAHTSGVFDQQKPQLILTSPPYPGVHVLYHRWQIGGRRETAAPYWIANRLDGDGERYYTLGNRHEKGLSTYFENLKASFAAIASVCTPDTTIVQMVAFSQPEWQLPKYLETMGEAGLTEVVKFADEQTRLWRDVPNRKWYAQFQPNQSSSREVVLVHRKT